MNFRITSIHKLICEGINVLMLLDLIEYANRNLQLIGIIKIT